MSLRYGVVLSVALLSVLAIYFVRSRPQAVEPAPPQSNSPEVAVVVAKESPDATRRPSVEEVDRAIAQVELAKGRVVFFDQLPDGVLEPREVSLLASGYMDQLSKKDAPNAAAPSDREAAHVVFFTRAGYSPNDAVIEFLPTFKNLEGLCANTDFPRVPPSGPASLFDQIYITDTAIPALSKLTRLRYLRLSQARLTSDGWIRLFRALPTLKAADVEFSRVDDAVLRVLPTIPGFAPEYLGLRGTLITDASVNALCKLISLKQIDVASTKLSSDGLTKIRRALPECVVDSE